MTEATILARARSAPVRRSRSLRHSKWPVIVLFLPPALLVFTVLVILPMGEAAWYSFFNWNGYGTPEKWVGLRNYQLIFKNGAFTTALKNNALIILISLLVQIPLALWLASMVSKRFPGALAFRLIFFLPFVLADVAAGMIWRFVYDGDFGLVAGVSRFIGVEPPFWLADRDVAMYAILGVIVWKYFGFHMMLFIAGLQAIDRNVLEGGGGWSELRAVSYFRNIRSAIFSRLPTGAATSAFWHVTCRLAAESYRRDHLVRGE